MYMHAYSKLVNGPTFNLNLEYMKYALESYQFQINPNITFHTLTQDHLIGQF